MATVALLVLGMLCSALSKNIDATSPHEVDGTMVGARVRCQGFLCPQWALDISRYDVVHYVQQDFQFTLQELLPLAPTNERSMQILTAFDAATRVFTVAACDYPEKGIDTLWSSIINEGVNGTTPLIVNKMIAHPDASVGSPGKIQLSRIVAGPSKTLFAVFNDGSIHEVNLDGQKYQAIGSLFSGAKDSSAFTVSHAHVMDGSVLKSFLVDASNNNYLVKTDFSTASPLSTTPLLLQLPRGMAAQEAPIGAFMMPDGPNASPRLMTQVTGIFDYFVFVDETTGKTESVLPSDLSNEAASMFFCDTATKDCDYWQTAAFDPVSSTLYYQAHAMDESRDSGIYALQYVQNKVTKMWYPVTWNTVQPMQFGYIGYQFVSVAK